MLTFNFDFKAVFLSIGLRTLLPDTEELLIKHELFVGLAYPVTAIVWMRIGIQV